MNVALSLAVLALLSLTLAKTASADEPPDNVQGNWTIYSTSLENGETVVKHVQIAQYGNRITGYFEGPDQSGPIQGEVNGHHIRFNTVTRTVIHFRGQIFGDNMSGEFGIHGKHAPWQAVRPATVVAPVPPKYRGGLSISARIGSSGDPERLSNSGTGSRASTCGAAGDGFHYPQGSSAPTAAPLSSDQLDSLVAPIALYPDALVAQVLAAAANPDQIAYADDWLAQNRNLTGTALAQAVDQQSWDPSVKALTQFPSVLDNLAHNLSWTSSLGQAFANQQADVMAAVQAMRAKAQAAGTLQSNSQITVTQPAANTIVIQPANPQVVYVPQYNPAVVYGASVVVPFYVPPPVPVASVRSLLWNWYHHWRHVRWRRLGWRLRLGLARLECQLGRRLGRWRRFDHHLQPQHLYQQPHLEQHELQRLSPLGRWSGRIAKSCLVWRQRHLSPRR